VGGQEKEKEEEENPDERGGVRPRTPVSGWMKHPQRASKELGACAGGGGHLDSLPCELLEPNVGLTRAEVLFAEKVREDGVVFLLPV
jgi:hypothetical protein